MREDSILSDILLELDENRETIPKKGREMARSVVATNTITTTAASNYLAKLGTKVSVLTVF